MKVFAELIQKLESTNKTNTKLAAIQEFLDEAEEMDKRWFLALFTGKRPKRMVSTTLLKQWVMEETQIPEWLFKESYSSVGDLGETIALLLPEPESTKEFTLAQWLDKILDLKDKPEIEKKNFVINAWKSLPMIERFIFNKLLGGSFRIGVSSKTLINALSKYYNLEANAVAHSIMGDWKVKETEFEPLVKGELTDTNLSKPYPFCLAYPIEKEIEELGALENWQAEYKWDGIRGQFIKRKGEIFIWSRGEELVSEQFPELTEDLLHWKGDFILDGEILVIKNDEILNFTELQKRLNRKVITPKLQNEIPVGVLVYDVIEMDNQDIRNEPLHSRRRKLEELFKRNKSNYFKISPLLNFETWHHLSEIRENSREVNSEGIMLKSKNSPYHVGRKKGDWWKWKIDPMTIDAVLIYAQKGSGRRSGFYTDYTFAVKDGDKLVTIAKAYSGLKDAEIKEVSRFVNQNAIEKFGPVKTVKPELVFEIAFEGIGYSKRHKSGVALRFPRIKRWRKDKKVEEIDELNEIKKLIH